MNRDWIIASVRKVWDGILQHLGTVIVAFLVSGGYLVALNWVTSFRTWVRGIPSDWILTPLVLLLVLVGVLVRINLRQRIRLAQMEHRTPEDDRNARFVTHFGVWWRVYPDSEYIEDFPYCPCCEPKKKLVQTQWYPDESFKCPVIGTEVKLYDHIPVKLEHALESLYNSYFDRQGDRLMSFLFREYNRRKELEPQANEMDLIRALFTEAPLNRIPPEERDKILRQCSNRHDAFSFLRRHHRFYRDYLRQRT